MFTIKIQLKDYKLKQYDKRLMTAIDKGLNDVADLIGTKADAILRGNELGTAQRGKHPGSFDTGMLAKSLIVNKDEEFKKTVSFEAPHSTYIEFGTAPHYPPMKPIYEWVMRNRTTLGINPHIKVIAKSPRMKATMPEYYKEAMAPTMGIVKKIGEEGSEAKPFLRPALNFGKTQAKGIISARIRKLEV